MKSQKVETRGEEHECKSSSVKSRRFQKSKVQNVEDANNNKRSRAADPQCKKSWLINRWDSAVNDAALLKTFCTFFSWAFLNATGSC